MNSKKEKMPDYINYAQWTYFVTLGSPDSRVKGNEHG